MGLEAVFHAFPFQMYCRADLNITDLLPGFQDELWIGDYGQGLYLVNFEQVSITQFCYWKNINPTALHYNDITGIYEDYSGHMWFGTDGAEWAITMSIWKNSIPSQDYQTPGKCDVSMSWGSIVVDKEKSVLDRGHWQRSYNSIVQAPIPGEPFKALKWGYLKTISSDRHC